MKVQVIAAAAAALMIAPTVMPTAANAGGILRPQTERNDDGIRVTLTGRVESIGQNDSFTVQLRNRSFRVTWPEIGGVGRAQSARPRVGNRVRVVGELLENDRISAEQVTLLEGGGGGRPSSVLQGTIRNLNQQSNQFTVDSTVGRDIRVEWNEDTQFIRNGTQQDRRGFREGDEVRVTGRRRADGTYLARRVVYGGRGGFTNRGIGEIVAIDSRDREVEIDFDGEVERVRLDNASIRRGQRTLSLNDLRIGWDVRVEGTGGGRGGVNATSLEVLRQGDSDRFGDGRPGDGRPGDGRPGGFGNNGNNNANLETVEGRVDEVLGDKTSFRLTRGGANDTIRILIDRNSRVVRGATDVGFEALRKGQRVRIRGRMVRNDKGNEQMDASRVEILP